MESAIAEVHTLCTSHWDPKCNSISVIKSVRNVLPKLVTLHESAMHRSDVLEIDGLDE